MSQLTSWLSDHLLSIIVILFGAWLLRRFGSRLISKVLHYSIRSDLYPNQEDRDKRTKTLDSLANAIMKVGVYILAAILIIGEVNPAYMAAIFASAGVIGIAIGFGAKDLVNDFMSGIFIITENQYRVGDVIEVANISGTVEDITVRTTVLRDLSGEVHHIPNGTIDVTTNKTLGYSGFEETITFAPETDMQQVKHIINHIGERIAADTEYKDIIIEAPHFLRIDGYSEDGILVKVVSKMKPGKQWLIKGVFYEELDKSLKKHQISTHSKQIRLNK